jgi:photosystem II stability/assembly factor-like uncharacterized protein
MDKDFNLESRLRRFAQGFRREANPPAEMSASLMAGLGERRRNDGPFAMVPAVAMAGLVLVAGLVIGYGAIQLRALGHPSPTPPISLVTPTPTATATASPSASATPATTPTPTPRVAGAPMQVIDLFFANQFRGWAIGSSCPQANNCPLQLRISDDGGHNWYAGNAPNVQALGDGTAWQIRFVSDQVGWLYGPQLYRTTDGGQTWTRVGLGHAVLSLAANGNSVWAIAADCSQGRCSNLSFYRSNDQGASWARDGAQPGMVGQGIQVLRVSDSTGWVLSWTPDGNASGSFTSALAVTYNGGQSWQQLVRPCAPQTSLVDSAAALADGTLWIVCGGDHAMGQMGKQVIISHDGGLHWSFPPDMPLSGYNSQIALAGDTHAWVATVHGPLYESKNSGASWQTATSRGVVVDLAGAGVSRVIFIDSQHGWAATDHAIFWTTDGGAHWSVRPPIG